MPNVDVLTNRIDIGRTGVNDAETVLKPQNVNAKSFGKLFTRAVDGDIYAQPLIVCDVQIAGAKRNVVYVATANNSVYAYDADDPHVTAPYWQRTARDFGEAVPVADIINSGNPGQRYGDFAKTVGITSTPAIDKTANVMYVVVKHLLPPENGKVRHEHVLHAIDIRDGSEMTALGSPRTIAASVPGNAPDAVGGVLAFNPTNHLNRPGLLLVNGVIYIAFGSHGDWNIYHGWVLAYSAKTLQPLAAFCDTPNGTEGGIWQSGSGLSSDGKSIFYVSGNGSVGNGNTSLCIGRLDLAGGSLKPTGTFIPGDWAELDRRDLDLTTAAVVVPGANEVIVGSKTGWAYIIDISNPASIAFKEPLLVSEVYSSPYESSTRESNVHGAPVVWRHTSGTDVFAWGEYSRLNAFRRTAGGYQALASSSMQVPQGMPGAMLALSVDGANANTGILWASHPYSESANDSRVADANQGTVGGVLRAFLATDVTTELWNSEMLPPRDRVGFFAKFCPPTVANGKVYLATFSDPGGTEPNALVVYGQLQSTLPSGPASPRTIADIGTAIVGKVQSARGRISITSAGDDIEQWADSFTFYFQKLAADGVITARVRTIDNRDPWVKAGVMIRDSVDPSSPHAIMLMTPGNGSFFQSRSQFRGPYANLVGPKVKVAYWVRAERRGAIVTGSVSSDSANWTVVGSETVAFSGAALFGLAVTSHVNGAQEQHPYATATFDSLTIAAL